MFDRLLEKEISDKRAMEMKPEFTKEELRQFRIENGFCPACGENMQNPTVLWEHQNGWCKGERK
jgi:hypothetical protein